MDRTDRLRRIIARARQLPLYQSRLEDLAPEDVTADDLSALPLIDRTALTSVFEADPTGGFLAQAADQGIQMHLTPAPGMGRMPEFLTQADARLQAASIVNHLDRCGIRAGDRCLVVFSYHMLAGGWLFHEGLLARGCTVLALGPGETQTAVDIASRYGFDVLVSNPSFAQKLGEAGGRFRSLIAAGEPFTAVPGYRDRVETAIGGHAYDAYGLSETGVIAAETSAQDGLHPLRDAAILEVIDPNTLEPVAVGEKGELVVTSLTREAMPILRYRTGDLTLRGDHEGELLLPRGVFGRTDAMVKAKGVKLYPKELLFLLAGTPGVAFRHHQLVLERDASGADVVRLRIQAEAGATVAVQDLGERLKRATGIRFDDIVVAPSVEGDLVVDRRFETS